MMKNGRVLRVTWRSADVARFFAIGALFVFAWKFFWLVYNALLLVLLAVLLAIVIHAPARLLSRWMPFHAGLIASIVVLVAAAGGIALAVVPQLTTQVVQLAAELPGALQSATTWLDEKTGGIPNGQLATRLTQQVGEFVGRFVPLAFNAIAALLGSFALVVLAVFLAAQPALYRSLVLSLAPPERLELWTRAYDEAGRNLRNWVLGKAATMLLVGSITYVGLLFFRIPGALALGVFAGLMKFIPNVGPTIGSAPAIIAAFLISPTTALWVAVFYFLQGQAVNAVTVPLIEHRAVDIPPAVLLVWQLMLAVGFGALALFVATPLLSIIVVVVRVLYYEPARARQAWDRREHALPVVARPSESIEPS